MIKKTVTYTNIEDQDVSEDFYFHLNTVEILDLEAETPGGISATLEQIIKTNNVQVAYQFFRTLLVKAYGQKTPTGGWTKRDSNGVPLYYEFETSDAAGELIITLLQNLEEAGKFIENLIPKNIAKLAEVAANESGASTPELPQSPAAPVAPPRPSPPAEEVKAPKDMNKEELIAAYKAKLEGM